MDGNPKETTKPFITTYGANFSFVGRDEPIEFIIKNSKEVIKHFSLSSEAWVRSSMFIVTGAPGIGKTRILSEFPSILHQQLKDRVAHSVGLYLSFADYYNVESEKISIMTSFSLRVLYAYFNLSIGFFQFLDLWITQFPGILLSTNLAMEYDSHHLLLDSSRHQEKFSKLQTLQMQLGSFQCSINSIFIVPVIGGAESIEHGFSSSYRYYSVPVDQLETLSPNSPVRQIISQTKFKDYWDLPAFKYALMFVGGWPRLLETLLNVMNDMGTTIYATYQDYREVLTQTRHRLEKHLGLDTANNTFFPTLLAYSITCKTVWSWETSCPEADSPTFKEFEQLGVITRYNDGVCFPLLFIDWNSIDLQEEPSFGLLLGRGLKSTLLQVDYQRKEVLPIDKRFLGIKKETFLGGHTRLFLKGESLDFDFLSLLTGTIDGPRVFFACQSKLEINLVKEEWSKAIGDMASTLLEMLSKNVIHIPSNQNETVHFVVVDRTASFYSPNFINLLQHLT
ncbi:hypothetical protein DFA_05843 [Cavenderia fasciculata]|uniref:Uncharacterized protein n=1 Tax=Cavenderia fasciculata TaxID=261658 RepID=F4PMW5_CACFS|nr:uncharacterized protein DFA_05843 [Cavenderia fasciculata]EGG23709.1 hypothetical protein DFA_05843 [Cavenderia fasciculata]|eukprot:XP_004361560.1 hypothetical protein DFA_05843 [Cavenderia fasciculata]